MRLAKRSIAVLACALLALGACKPDTAPQAQVPGPPDGPAATVIHLAQRLGQDDLAGFARDAVPAADYATFARAWSQDLSRWPLSELPLPERIVPMLATLSANDAERQLGMDYDRQLAGQTQDLRNAAQTLGLFATQYVRNQGDFTPAQRKHLAQVIPALSSWAQDAPLADAPRAHTALRELVAAARATGIDSDLDLREAGMEASLRRLDPFLATFVKVLDDYGLSLHESLAQLVTGAVTIEGDVATVQVRYPLAGKPITLPVTLRRQAGHWYVADYMDRAEALRKRMEQTPSAPDPDQTPAEPAPAEDKVALRLRAVARGHWA